MLRVLALRGQTHVTARAFEYLTLFPALAIFTTESMSGIGPQDKGAALAFGWKYKTGKDLSSWLVSDSGVGSSKWDDISQAFFKLGGQLNAETLTVEDVKALDAFPVVHLAVGGHAEDAAIDVAGEGRMRVWHRLSMVDGLQSNEATQLALPDWSNSDGRTEARRLSAPSTMGFPQKRAPDSVESHAARKKVKPAIRASKEQHIGDLLSEFGS